MDEIWQRHKVFIVQCVIGTIVLLIAWAVHSNLYADIDLTRRNTQARHAELQQKLANGEAPSKRSIDEQQSIAAEGEAQIEAMARKVASVASVDQNKIAYVRENIGWILTNIGQPERTDEFVGLYEQLPQTCLSRLREESRSVLASTAAELGRSLDETLGINAGFQDDEVPIGIHGLAIVVDIVKRGFDIDIETEVGDAVIDSVDEIRVAVRSRRSKMDQGDTTQIVQFPVRITLRGSPAAVMSLLVSFNQTGNPVQRMTVLESIEGGEREREDSDRVRITFNLLGLHHLGVAGAQGGAGK
jgi:hypothetical protein